MLAKPVLFAIPEETKILSGGDSLADYLRNEGFVVIEAFSYEDALEIIQSQNLLAVVMISNWAMKPDNNSAGLMQFLKDKCRPIPSFHKLQCIKMNMIGLMSFIKIKSTHIKACQQISMQLLCG